MTGPRCFVALLLALHWRLVPSFHCFSRYMFRLRSPLAASDDFDGKEFNDALKSAGSVWGGVNTRAQHDGNNELFEKIRENQVKQAEEIYKDYPFSTVNLPILPEHGNYYSGKFGVFFWHQNADQVYVFLPIGDDVKKNDISVKFEVKSVSVKVKGEEIAFFECLERIIPDGSFWVIEVEGSGQRYIQLDLEKRYRMINWKNLFGEPTQESARDMEQSRSDMLEKLFAANKGMSRITGQPAETIEQMQDDEELMRMIGGDVDGKPLIDWESDDDMDATVNESVTQRSVIDSELVADPNSDEF